MARMWKRGGNKVYLQVSGGNLVQRLDEHYQGDCIERKLKMWKNAWKMVKEHHFPSVEWFITNVEIKTSDFWNQVMVTLDNEIVVQFSSNDFISICNTMLNFWHGADLSKEIEVSSYTWNDGYGKFSIWQSWEMVKWFVNKENSKELWCPQATKKTVAGKVKWDFDDVNNWYFNEIGKWIQNTFPNGSIATPEWATSNVSEQQKLADQWEQGSVNDVHKDEEAPVAWYAAKPTGWEPNPEVWGTAQAQAQTWNTKRKDEEEISIEELPF